MEFEIISKQERIPPFNSQAVKIQRIEYFDYPYTSYSGEEITEEIIAEVLKEIPKGINMYLFLDPDGEGNWEDNWLEINCDGEWLALGFWRNAGQHFYYSYNPVFADTADQINNVDSSDKDIYTNLISGGQSPIPKREAITDVTAGVKAVEYFIRTGKCYPGIDWVYEYD